MRSTRRSPASSGNRRQETAPTARRQGPPTRWSRSGRGRKPLKREAWTWQQDETSLQGTARSKPSRACETLRAEHRRAWDVRRMWTRGVDVAKRLETPRKAPGQYRADAGTTNSGGEPSSREDEPSIFTDGGGRYRRKTITVRPKWRGMDGIGVTRKRRYDDTHNTLQGSQLHERLPSPRRRDGGYGASGRESSKGNTSWLGGRSRPPNAFSAHVLRALRRAWLAARRPPNALVVCA